MCVFDYIQGISTPLSVRVFEVLRHKVLEAYEFDILDLRVVDLDWGYNIGYQDIIQTLVYIPTLNLENAYLFDADKAFKFYKAHKKTIKKFFRNEVQGLNMTLEALFLQDLDLPNVFLDKEHKKLLKVRMARHFLVTIALFVSEFEMEELCKELTSSQQEELKREIRDLEEAFHESLR